jgi:hypothetical protein
LNRYKDINPKPSTYGPKIITLEYAFGALPLPDVANDFLHVLRLQSRYGGHVAIGPVMLGNALSDGAADAEVRVMAGVVNAVNQGRAKGGANGAKPMAGRTVGIEEFFTLAGGFHYVGKCCRWRLECSGFGDERHGVGNASAATGSSQQDQGKHQVAKGQELKEIP